MSNQPIRVVPVRLGDRSYDIHIAPGLIDRLGEQIRDLLPANLPVVVVTPKTIESTWGARAAAGLAAAGFKAELCVVADTEGAKSLVTVAQILDFLVERKLPRQAVIVAVGGGVIGDMAGFAAAIYLRGIQFVQVPTTLLAMVDASVGGKTGVNHEKGKNLIGAFHQPRRVIMDIDSLGTLDERVYRAGLAEVIKHGVIRDAELFALLESRMDGLLKREPDLLAEVIQRNCQIKAAVVEADERESDVRGVLNFGHTIGHAVENLTAASGMQHGEAVAIGMAGASRLACKMNLWTREDDARLEALLRAARLPVRMPALDSALVMDRMLRDKKARDGRLRFALPERMGWASMRDDVPEQAVWETLEELRA